MKKYVISVLLVAVLSGSSRVAVADSDDAWHEGPAGRQRKLHLVITLSVGAAYLTTAVLFHDALAPDQCRWCEPPSIDVKARNALVWDRADRARTTSDILGAFAIPTLSVVVPNLLLIGSDPGFGDVLDVTLPIAETVLATQILTYFAKSAIGRQRPYAHFGSARPSADTTEDNVSHWSGHTSLSFALATSAGMVARMRNMKAEPAIWAVGMTLAASTGYLRIAGDMHYLTDVLVGAAVGLGAGFTIPRLIDQNLAITTSGKTVMLVGQF
ncbi:MAG: phosphatase PAP2 family protein [Kofleriaceae bacterium]